MAAPIDGDGGDNYLVGTVGDDVIRGFGGNDIVYSVDGLDSLLGGTGNDALYGGTDIDTLDGGDGDDTLQGVDSAVLLSTSGPSDVINGGAGIDLLIVSYAGFVNSGTGQPAAITLNASLGNGQVQVQGFQGESFTQIERLNFTGPDGADVVTGGNYNDSIDGRGGNDILKGGKGDDTVIDSWGVVNADGGAGVDAFQLYRNVVGHADTGDAVIDGNAGTITVGGAAMGTFRNFESLTVYTGGGNDRITGISGGTNYIFAGYGVAGDKSFLGQELSDTLTGGVGNDTLNGRAGNDNLTGYGGSNSLNGDAGNDVMTVVSVGGIDTLNGGAGSDTMNVGGRGTTAIGGQGDDLLFVYQPYTAAAGTESYQGGVGTDIFRLYFEDASLDFTGTTLTGFEQLDFVDYGGAVNLTVKLTSAQFAQFDKITFGVINGGDDSCVIELVDDADIVLNPHTDLHRLVLADGGQRADLSDLTPTHLLSLIGGDGADTVIGISLYGPYLEAELGDGNDRFAGGVGRESIHGGGGRDVLDGRGGNDVVKRTDDVLFGDAGNDRLLGGNRNDKLDGGTGNDQLSGGAGADTLLGGTGRDTLTGGADADVFRFLDLAHLGLGAPARDVITDFKVPGDRIDVSRLDGREGTPGNQDFDFIGTGPFTGEGQIGAVRDGANTILQFNSTGAGGAEFDLLLRNVVAASLSDAQFLV